jgi:murein L,D-transpeptidase YcbB/YkuD
MASKLSSLLRKVYLASLAGIGASNTSTANNITFEFDSNKDEIKLEPLFIRKVDLSPKLLLERSINNELSFMAHRSHRSHSSHRSHYSSYNNSNTEKSPPKTNQGLQPNSAGNSNSNLSSGTTNEVLQFGARTLKIGMSGTDVTELVNILLKKQYLKLDDGGTQVTGIYTYDGTIEGAVKKFQSDNGLTSDGVCGSATIYYLKNK